MANVYHGRGYIYCIEYHIVWCVKYRRKVLTNKIENSLKEILNKIAEDNNFNILEIKSLLIASLFHDAGHNGKMEVLDKFTALDHFRKTMDKFPDFIVYFWAVNVCFCCTGRGQRDG